MRADLIAPCGMNCGVCMAYLRQKKNCPGCRSNGDKPAYCTSCSVVLCDKRGNEDFCFTCDVFPCRRIRQLDARYRGKYRMSMIDNLHRIRDNGMEAFLEAEKLRWTCPRCGRVLSAHRENCLFCGARDPAADSV